MSERVTYLLQRLTPSDARAVDRRTDDETFATLWSSSATADEIQEFWDGVQQLSESNRLDFVRLNLWLQTLVANPPLFEKSACADTVVSTAGQLYRSWPKIRPPEQTPPEQTPPEQTPPEQTPPEQTPPRHRLLIVLLQYGGPKGWQEFAELMVTDPPTDVQEAIEAFVPIWRTPDGPFERLFPRLLDAVEHLSIAAIVLDLANYLARQERMADHPARARAADLTWLLGQLVERLEGFEEASRKEGVRDLQVAEHVQESITLAVALCHTLSLLEYREAVGKLYRMLELQHRRLRVEAAASLAKLGEETGAKMLIEMAAEPLVRLRVHAYTEELGIVDQVPEERRTPAALAESELVIRLAEPDLFGVSPSTCELIDQRLLAWPGYDEPRNCFLFRYTYHFAAADYTNIAITGPVTHTLAADLTAFEPEDIYAAYAGWYVEHEELQQVNVDLEDPAEAQAVLSLNRSLQDSGYQSIVPVCWGQFFGARLYVAAVERGTQRGTIVVHEGSYEWFPQGNPQHPLTPEIAYDMFVGRQLLQRFNDDDPSVEAAP